MFKVIVEPEASIDIDNACEYYYSFPVDTNRLVDSFLADLKVAFDTLSVNPYYQFRTQKYRAIPLKKFPYLLFFNIDEIEKVVKVLSVFNTYQDTEKYPS